MRCTSTEALQNFWPSYRQWSRYHMTVCQVNTVTHAVHWLTQCFEFGKSRFQTPRCNSIILNLVAALYIKKYFYITRPSFMTLTIYCKLQNTLWSDEYSVHKINPDNHLKCGLQVTVKLYRVACSLSYADSHFFQAKGIHVRAICLISVPQHNIGKVRDGTAGYHLVF
jgi:hypothetical protein